MADDFERSGIHTGHVILGGMLMALGAVFLLGRLDVVAPWAVDLWFPLLLVVFGLARIVWPRRNSPVPGVWIALVGGLILLDRLGIVAMHESWPVFVIMAGMLMIFRALGWLPNRHDVWRERRRWTEVQR